LSSNSAIAFAIVPRGLPIHTMVIRISPYDYRVPQKMFVIAVRMIDVEVQSPALAPTQCGRDDQVRALHQVSEFEEIRRRKHTRCSGFDTMLQRCKLIRGFTQSIVVTDDADEVPHQRSDPFPIG